MIHRSEAPLVAGVVVICVSVCVLIAHAFRNSAQPDYLVAVQRNAEVDAADFLLARGETEFRDLACFLRPSGLYTCRAFTDGYPVFLRCYARAHTWEAVSGARCRVQP